MKPQVTILLSTYNGELYLDDQLESVFKQNNVDIRVHARDDGSTDNTCAILDEWAKEYPLSWYTGNNLGPAQSFMDLIYTAPDSEFYAFCDQDDVWDEDKIEAAIRVLETEPKDQSLLYFCGYRTVDSALNVLSENVRFNTVSYGNALIQNIALGCSMVFNSKAQELAKKINTTDGNMHDAWMYKICYSVGRVCYDSDPHFSYRQHNENVIGGKRNSFNKWKRRSKRFKKIWNGRIRSHTKVLLDYCEPYIKDSSKKKLILTLTDYKKNLKNRLKLFLSREIIMQSKLDTMIFKILVLFGRV